MEVGTEADLSHIHEKLRALAAPTARMEPDPENARHHDDESLRAIMESLRMHGQMIPVVGYARDDGVLQMVAGSGRLLAARILAVKDPRWQHLAALEYPNREAAMRVAFSLQDNRSAELATWNPTFLRKAMEFVTEAGLAHVDLGWSDEEAKAILALPGAAEPPAEFPDVTNPATNTRCPKCAYEWSE